MSLKIKISILTICFALLAAVCVGFAFAAPSEKLNLKGTLSYEVPRPVVMVSPNDPDLGSTTGSGDYTIGETVTLTATPSSGSNISFLAWATSTDPNEMEIVSTSPTYSFEIAHDSPTTYFALFNSTETEHTDTVGDLTYILYNEAKLAKVAAPTSTELSSVEIPAFVQNDSSNQSFRVYSIGVGVFNSQLNLTSVTLPNTLIEIGLQAFTFCSNLKTFKGEGNDYYSIDDGRAIITDGGKTLLAYAPGNELASYEIPDGVTSITAAFMACHNLTSVSLPNSLTSIGDYAFYNCSNLTSVSLPSTLTSIGGSAFSYCRSLTSVSLPSTLTSIGKGAFQDCYSLTSITIPEKVTEIGASAFYCCFSLAIVYNNSNLEISAVDTEDYGYIGRYVKEIVTSNNPQVGRIEIVDDVQYYVNEQTGKNIALAPSVSRNSLINLTIREGTKEIGAYAFYYCGNLTTTTILEEVTAIHQDAFSYCNNLTSITLPSTLRSIYGSPFLGCYALALVYNNSNLKITAGSIDHGEVGYYAKEVVTSGGDAVGKIETEGNVQYYVNEQTGENIALAPSVSRNSLINLTIREGTKEIGDYAFYNCSNLTSVSLPSTLTSIGGSAFWSCISLEEITINGNITNLERSAFSSCGKLTSLTLGKDVSTLPSDLFDGLTNLTEIVVLGDLTSTTFPSGTWYKGGEEVTSFDGEGVYTRTDI